VLNKLKSRFKYQLAAETTSVISGGVLTVALARLLTPDEYGILFLSISVLGSVALLSKLGIAKSGARYISKYKENDPGQVPHIVKYTLSFNLIAIVTTSLILVWQAELLAAILGEPGLVPFLLIGSLYVFGYTLSKYYRIVLQGFERIDLSSKVYITDRTARIIMSILLVLLGFGAIGAFVGYVIGFLLAALLGTIYTYMEISGLDEGDNLDGKLRWNITKYTLPVTFTSMAGVLDNYLDTILVGYFLGPFGVAIYTVAKQVEAFIQAPIAALGFTIAPSFEVQKSNNKIERASRVYETSLITSLVVYIPACLGLIAVAGPLVELVFGSRYSNGSGVLQILAVYAIFRAVTKVTGEGLDFLGRAKDRAKIKFITAVLNVILNVILIPKYGVQGAAIATVSTYSIYTIFNYYIMNKELAINHKNIIKKIFQITLASTPMYILVNTLSGQIANIIMLVSIILFGVIVYSATAIIMRVFTIGELQDLYHN